MARRFSREQRSQKYLDRPFSTELAHESGGASPGATAPQKSQVTATFAAYARKNRTPGSHR